MTQKGFSLTSWVRGRSHEPPAGVRGKGRGWRRSHNAATRFCPGPGAGLCWLTMRTILFTLISLGCMAALAGPVYKWVDENGVVHYSDQPHPDPRRCR